MNEEFKKLKALTDEYDDSELRVHQGTMKHYGVLGMKWGVRKSRTRSSDSSTVQALKKKKTYELTNEELKTITKRLQLEQQYRQLNPTSLDKGKKLVGSLLTGPLKGLTQNAIKGVAGEMADKYGDEIFKAAMDAAKRAKGSVIIDLAVEQAKRGG